VIRKSLLIVLAVIATLLLLASCKPVCEGASLVAPVLASPSDRSTVSSLTPSLAWTYPDDSCNPDGYRITLQNVTDFGTELGTDTGSMDLSWNPSTSLQPTTMYRWAVAAMSGSTVGPVADIQFFFTGPDCTAETLSAPNIIFPADGSVVTTSSITILLELEGCVPYEMKVDLTTDPTFHYGTAYTYDPPSTAWTTPYLMDCEWWYIRAESRDGSGGSAMSDTVSFYTNIAGTCAEPDALASVYGIVWQDECPVATGTVPSPIPAGCVLNSWGTGVWGDGIRQPGEDGIPDVTVLLGEGLCPSTGLASTVTDANGFYAFKDLEPGWYCISINADDNAALRKLGLWRRFMSGYEWTYSINELHAGDAVSQDFGWYPYTESTSKSSGSQCPPGQTWNALSGGCQGECPADMTWNFQTGQCEIHSCAAYKTQSDCEAHAFCFWGQGQNGYTCLTR
jgi:hypothetical protein